MFPIHKIVFWESSQDKGSSEINFKSEVLSISSSDGVLMAAFENRVSGFKLKDLSKFVQLKTCDNPLGLHTLQVIKGRISLATPHI